ncbi:DUF2065 domain-containing protein [Tabrizicola sp. TH137]|uniref:DUF2065 domain-containing protein n=1 Tax=Tabrizicola sp. TH137 TaxID=2067452 RepID=UPI000C7C3668|nr:DUF2065 domain-containing protein [Tabrizicola sp. TH137]PLL11069.1 DUF2065 domain-containing protein [Tabrizicola sp. TH137]
MTWVLLGLGLVLVIEGLALALAPSHIRAVLEFLASLPPDRARLIGLLAMTGGTGLLWLAFRLMG